MTAAVPNPCIPSELEIEQATRDFIDTSMNTWADLAAPLSTTAVCSVLHLGDHYDVRLSCGHSVTRSTVVAITLDDGVECIACEVAAVRAAQDNA